MLTRISKADTERVIPFSLQQELLKRATMFRFSHVA